MDFIFDKSKFFMVFIISFIIYLVLSFVLYEIVNIQEQNYQAKVKKMELEQNITTSKYMIKTYPIIDNKINSMKDYKILSKEVIRDKQVGYTLLTSKNYTEIYKDLSDYFLYDLTIEKTKNGDLKNEAIDSNYNYRVYVLFNFKRRN